MRFGIVGGTFGLIGALLAIGTPNTAKASHPARHSATAHRDVVLGPTYSSVRFNSGRHYSRMRFASVGYGGEQCVPFARENSGIELSGNAVTWWEHAEGVYQRGARPEVGSVLNFRATGRMHMGHVAVVTNVVNPRSIEIDHANWSGPGVGRGGISRNIQVVDVSPNNDWSAVRVALGSGGDFGSIYPTYGFIYDRPDAGTMVANNQTAPAPVLNTAPRDLRPAGERNALAQLDEEVAEAPDDMAPASAFRHPRSRHVTRIAGLPRHHTHRHA